jgi:pantoate--beta-alanine ligase
MIIFKHSSDLRSYLKTIRLSSDRIGFVPTMGALHEGHLSLINESKAHTELTVCSIFVNRTQFNNSDDYEKYPVTTESDIRMLESHGCDVLFMPGENEIYPDAASKEKHFDLGYLETILEGKYRPGHFQGVCLIVEKLLNIVEPNVLFLGQKDFQQCLVIKRLIQLMEKNIELLIVPTQREADGLAMSSRNLRLIPDERARAPKLYEALTFIKENMAGVKCSVLKHQTIASLENQGFKVDYLEIANQNDLQIVTDSNKENNLVILVAAFLNEVRLIDNLLIN